MPAISFTDARSATGRGTLHYAGLRNRGVVSLGRIESCVRILTCPCLWNALLHATVMRPRSSSLSVVFPRLPVEIHQVNGVQRRAREQGTRHQYGSRHHRLAAFLALATAAGREVAVSARKHGPFTMATSPLARPRKTKSRCASRYLTGSSVALSHWSNE